MFANYPILEKIVQGTLPNKLAPIMIFALLDKINDSDFDKIALCNDLHNVMTGMSERYCIESV